jgi:hypothetical protein
MAFRICVDETARTEDQDRLFLLEVEREAAGRGEVLDAIEAAIPFGRVEKIAVPLWLGVIIAVAACNDLRKRRIRTPGDAWAIHCAIEVADGVLAMQRVVIASGDQRAHIEPAWACRALLPPAQHGFRSLARYEQLMHDFHPAWQDVPPARPWITCKASQTLQKLFVTNSPEIAIDRFLQHLQPDTLARCARIGLSFPISHLVLNAIEAGDSAFAPGLHNLLQRGHCLPPGRDQVKLDTCLSA